MEWPWYWVYKSHILCYEVLTCRSEINTLLTDRFWVALIMIRFSYHCHLLPVLSLMVVQLKPGNLYLLLFIYLFFLFLFFNRATELLKKMLWCEIRKPLIKSVLSLNSYWLHTSNNYTYNWHIESRLLAECKHTQVNYICCKQKPGS